MVAAATVVASGDFASDRAECSDQLDRNEPELGFKFNATRALSLPDVCDAHANITDCPRLLNLPKGSKDAEIFEQFGNATTKHGKGNAQSIEEGSSSFHSNGVGRSYYLKGQGLLEVQLPLLLLALPLVLFGS
ncbi:hypothetical protein J5N97_011034 [Dioscorea zingiberensis]|uniref:GPI-anchored protein n=1 Tax=Dioscorea zingiberensis TaxID=325984 RepID=A0A9D5D1H1_9LILI|nr:hypothetical protein J5N97_011034 [Dioscorea zingiberensis]